SPYFILSPRHRSRTCHTSCCLCRGRTRGQAAAEGTGTLSLGRCQPASCSCWIRLCAVTARLPDVLLAGRDAVHELIEICLLRLGRRLQVRNAADHVERLGHVRTPYNRRMTGGNHANVQILDAVHVALEFVQVQQLEPGAVHAVEHLQAFLPGLTV